MFVTLLHVFFQYNKHLFVHIGQTNHSYSDALLESVDIRQIYDKFPEKKGGLKELYGKGSQNSFFLIKFWVSVAAAGLIIYRIKWRITFLYAHQYEYHCEMFDGRIGNIRLRFVCGDWL